MALVTGNNILGRNTTTTGAGYHNIFYDWVLAGLKQTLNNEYPGAKIYIAPEIMGSPPAFSIRLWGSSSELENEAPQQWTRKYNIDIEMYSVEKNATESFYKQFYSDIEHLHQVLFNNKTLTITQSITVSGSSPSDKSFTWYDGTVGDIVLNEYDEGEEEIDGLNKASIPFSCLVEREG
tara:strand:- start:1828 stop:2364 length:537 start_codon:yes stop_codon:yes gene_type:complete